jgi:hypothetical protein
MSGVWDYAEAIPASGNGVTIQNLNKRIARIAPKMMDAISDVELH